MTTDGTMRVQTDPAKPILLALRKRIGPQKFNAWFNSSTSISINDGEMKVIVANPFIAGWIESHFVDDLASACNEITGKRPRIAISVDPALNQRLHRGQRNLQANLVKRNTNGTTRGHRKVETKLRYRFEDFVVGPSNQLAYSAAVMVATQQSVPFNPLFIHGACGVGKTHLLQSICNAVAENNDKKILWKYITAEQFTNEFIHSIRNKKTESFRKAYRQLDILVIDDVHFLAAKRATQEEFLHTFNTIAGAKKKIVMASDAHPRMLGKLTKQLISRFLSGMVVKIDPPDQETRVKILQRIAERLKLEVPDEILHYISLHIHGSVRELEGALVKLSALLELSGGTVTLEMAREALADYLARTDSAITLGQIESVVSAFFGITPADIHSTRRTHTVSLARAIVMFLTRRYTRMSFPEIGQLTGKNHSSVVLAVQRIEKMLAENQTCRWMTPAGPKSKKARELLDLLTKQIENHNSYR